METGRVVLLNGAPRSGKSSIVVAVQDHVPGRWMNLGNDVFIRHVLPPSLRPGIGPRPGSDRPEVAAIRRQMTTRECRQARFRDPAAPLDSARHTFCGLHGIGTSVTPNGRSAPRTTTSAWPGQPGPWP